MKKIYAPWRSPYVTKTANMPNEERMRNKCIFCHELDQNDDEKFFILKRLPQTFIMLNLYPYNGGHIMVLPKAHKGKLDECSVEERSELIEAVNLSITVLQQVLKPHGFNIGLNQGKAGGGGIPSHLHFHVLPRWEGDTNFLPLLCDTKQISVDLQELFGLLKKNFE